MSMLARCSLPLLVLLLAPALAGAQARPNLLGVQFASAVVAGPRPPAPDDEIEDLVKLARRTRDGRTEWQPGAALTGARNAHSTNTKEQMREALEHGYSFLEGDVRQELNAPHAIEMRHDGGHESGDNLTLRQWLEIGLASGRGLKLDVKEPQHMARIMDTVEEYGIDHGRLMFNLGFSGMGEWGRRIRERFPSSWLAINPPSGEGAMSSEQIEGMLAQARDLGGSVTFVIRFEHLTREAIDRLQLVGPVSVWNSPYEGRDVEDAQRVASKLREKGVAGVIDIRASAGLADRIEHVADIGANVARTEIEQGLDRVESTVVNVGRGAVNGVTKVTRGVGNLIGL